MGDYSVSSQLEGFKQAIVVSQPVKAGWRIRINFELRIGDWNETVEQPGVPLEIGAGAETTESAALNPDEQLDRCFVWALDLNRSREVLLDRGMFREGLSKLSKEEMTALTATFQTRFDEFYPEWGEEVLTNRYYSFPYGDGMIVASVYYTDESMAGNVRPDKVVVIPSMFLCVVVADGNLPNACEAPGSAVAETTHTDYTMKTRVKTRVEVNSRPYVVGMECERPKTIETLGNKAPSDQ